MRHTYRNRKTIGLISTLALALVATASLGIASSPATAQISDLNAADCDSTDAFMLSGASWGETAREQCRALVAFRNTLVGQSNLQPGHKLLQWGRGDKEKFVSWPGLNFTSGPAAQNPDMRRVTGINISDTNNGVLSGEIPLLNLTHKDRGRGDKTLFDSVHILNMEKGALTGGFPPWIYDLTGLQILDLASNQLTGSVYGIFAATDLHQIELQGNRFSGELPAIPFSNHLNLSILSLGSNNFSGQFPAEYSQLGNDTRRKMRILAFGGNRISGNLPQWVDDITWSSDYTATGTFRPGLIEWVFNLGGNRLCYDTGLELGTQKADDDTDASVRVNLSGNVCEGEFRETKYTPGAIGVVSMEVSGDSVEVTWVADADQNAEYILQASELYPESLQGELPAGIELSSKCAKRASPTSAGEGLLRDTLSQSTGGANCKFHPDYMAVTVSKVIQEGSRTDGRFANAYIGGSEGRGGWNFTHVLREQPIQDIAYNLSMNTNTSISYWDGSNQRWHSYRVGQQSPNPRLEVGTPVAHPLVSRGWMDRIGVGSSGNNAFVSTGVTLYGGWNMISAGGEASGEGAFMFDDDLVDCENLGGAIMILRYNPASRSYDVILPCHPTVQRSLIAGGAWGSIEEISEFDNLMIYFRSTLPVNIRWDTVEDSDNPQYRPATLSN